MFDERDNFGIDQPGSSQQISSGVDHGGQGGRVPRIAAVGP